MAIAGKHMDALDWETPGRYYIEQLLNLLPCTPPQTDIIQQLNETFIYMFFCLFTMN